MINNSILCAVLFVSNISCGWECRHAKRPTATIEEGSYEGVYVTLEAESEADADITTADDVAKMTWATIQAAKGHDFENMDEIENYLASGHVYLAATPQVFYDLWHADMYSRLPETPEEFSMRVAGYIHVPATCTLNINGNYLIAIGPGRFGNALVYHELSHVVSFMEYGYSDYNHENKELFGHGPEQLIGEAGLVYNELVRTLKPDEAL